MKKDSGVPKNIRVSLKRALKKELAEKGLRGTAESLLDKASQVEDVVGDGFKLAMTVLIEAGMIIQPAVVVNSDTAFGVVLGSILPEMFPRDKTMRQLSNEITTLVMERTSTKKAVRKS